MTRFLDIEAIRCHVDSQHRPKSLGSEFTQVPGFQPSKFGLRGPECTGPASGKFSVLRNAATSVGFLECTPGPGPGTPQIRPTRAGIQQEHFGGPLPPPSVVQVRALNSRLWLGLPKAPLSSLKESAVPCPTGFSSLRAYRRKSLTLDSRGTPAGKPASDVIGESVQPPTILGNRASSTQHCNL